MYRAALNCILSELLRKKKLHYVEDFNVDQPKTKSFVKELNKLKISNSLFIINENKINVFLAGRNIKDVEIVSPLGINPHNLMKYNDVVIDSSALETVEKIAS